MRHSTQTIQHAKDLRRRGLSYNKISNICRISKGTLHYWFTDLPKSPYQTDPQIRIKHLAKARILASAALQAKKNKRDSEIQKCVLEELQKFPFDDSLVQKTILSFLYWAEGSKTTSQFTFTNTDPALCLLFITLMRKAYQINEESVRIRLHLHHYHNVSEIKEFWSKLLNVPKNQFEKIYLKSRKHTKKKRKNFAGICFIKYGKGGAELKQKMLYFTKVVQEKLAPLPTCARSSTDRT